MTLNEARFLYGDLTGRYLLNNESCWNMRLLDTKLCEVECSLHVYFSAVGVFKTNYRTRMTIK